jgi:hypothetical protein
MQSKSNAAQDPATGGYGDVRIFYNSRGFRLRNPATDCRVSVENHLVKGSTQKYAHKKKPVYVVPAALGQLLTRLRHIIHGYCF